MAKKKLKSTLSTRAMLVSVKISQWTARKMDKRATETANSVHKADPRAGAYNKKMLPGAVELEEVATIATQARKFFYEQTLPWMTDGSRIISSQNYLPFAKEMQKFKAKYEQATKEFVTAYPRLQKEARQLLGDLYNDDEYPHKSEIGDRFGLEIDYLPMPDVKDFRTDVTDKDRRDLEKKLQKVQQEAMRDLWTRLHGVVKNAADKLAEPKAIFRDSLLENIREMVSLLPKLNISDDAALEKARRELEKTVSNFEPDDLRTDAKERAKASKQLSDIEAKMGAFMGR